MTDRLGEAPRVALGRNLLVEADPVVFYGEWSPDEPPGWERFTVMLHGYEAGEIIEATISDLRAIVDALSDTDKETPDD